MQIIRKNFGLKLLALALAIVGWAYFRFATNPIVAAARFNQQISLPIAAVDLAPGLVAHYTERQAVVTVETKPGEPAVRPDEIKAVLGLPPEVRTFALMPIGYPERSFGLVKRRPLAEVAMFDRYGSPFSVNSF